MRDIKEKGKQREVYAHGNQVKKTLLVNGIPAISQESVYVSQRCTKNQSYLLKRYLQ